MDMRSDEISRNQSISVDRNQSESIDRYAWITYRSKDSEINRNQSMEINRLESVKISQLKCCNPCGHRMLSANLCVHRKCTLLKGSETELQVSKTSNATQSKRVVRRCDGERRQKSGQHHHSCLPLHQPLQRT